MDPWKFLTRALAAFIVIVSGAAVGSGTAHACSCADQPLAEYADDVVAAFVGIQTDRIVVDGFADDGAVLTFDVDRAFVGDVQTPFAVRTHPQSSACGLDTSNLGQVAVVAFGSHDDPHIGLCGSLRSVDELVGIFGTGFEPSVVSTTTVPDDSGGSSSTVARLGLAGVLLAIAGAGGAYAIRQRRS